MCLRWAAILGGLTIVVLSGAACSGGDDAGRRVGAATEDGLREMVNNTYAKLFAGDWKALYRNFTEDCRNRVSYADFAGQMVVARASFEDAYKIEFKDLAVKEVEILSFDGTSATTRATIYSTKDPALNLNEDRDEISPWAYEDGEWRSANCAEFPGG